MAYNAIDIKNGSDHELPISANSSDGWCKMADGTLIQWRNSNNNVGNKTYNFTLPFVGSVPTVVASIGAGSGRGYCCVEDVSNTGFTLWVSTEYTVWHRWIAIGRWK